MRYLRQIKPALIILCACAIVFSFYQTIWKVSAQSIEDSKNVKPGPTPLKTNEPKKNVLMTSEKKLKIGDTEIKIAVLESAESKPIYFRPHENEMTSSRATAEIIKKRGGTFIELKSKGERNIEFLFRKRKYSFDPNRIFTKTGIEKTLGGGLKSDRKAAIREISSFVDNLFSLFLTDKKLLIAVHNNTNGGGLSIETYKNNADAADVHINKSRDPDDFFYVTDEKHFESLKDKNFNVILQDSENAADDGSLSIYCGKNNIAYINVESEHGHLRQQIEMLDALEDLINENE